MEREIYIVVSQTGSVVSKILQKFVTHAEYNHVSVSLDPELKMMYSFGRWYPYFPWIGGFTEESPDFGTLKRFPDAQVVVLAVPITEEMYDEVGKKLEEMLKVKYTYHYDTLGLLFAARNKVYRRKNHFYCSEFVRQLLVTYGIELNEAFPRITQPIDFLNMPKSREIYRGRLHDYSSSEKEVNA